MTEAAFKKKKNTQTASDSRVTTHPSYTEYSWDTLVGNNRPASAANMEATASLNRTGVKGGARRMNNTAASRRGATEYGGGTARYKNAPASGAKKRADSKSTADIRTKASATVKEQVKKAEKIRKKSIVAIHTIAVEKKYSFPASSQIGRAHV